MNERVAFDPQQQEAVDAYFQTQSSFWKTIYEGDDVYARIHQDRHAEIVRIINTLKLAPGAQVLEIGCGAGMLSVALATRGLRVEAVDSASAMVDQTQARARDAGVADRLSVAVADVHALPFADARFDLVIAIGVIPWVERPAQAIAEMARVVKPGGHVLFTADNRARLNGLLDPWLNPLVAPLKRTAKMALARAGLRRPSLQDVGASAHSRRYIDRTLDQVGLVKITGKTLGFGPWSLMRHDLVADAPGVAIHHRLQRWADHGAPILRATGAHYIVLACK